MLLDEHNVNKTYDGPDRRQPVQAMVLTDDQVEIIANKAADKAVEKLTNQIYVNVGKGVVKRFFYLLGAATVGVYLWLVHVGWLPPPKI